MLKIIPKKYASVFYLFNLFIIGSIFFMVIYFDNFSLTGLVTGNNYDDYLVYVIDSYEDETVSFVIPVENKQNETIKVAYAEIRLVDSVGAEVALLKTDSISIAPYEKKELLALWDTEKIVGIYQARVVLFLDEESYAFTKLFDIDRKILSFDSVLVNEFSLGKVSNFSILIQNHLSTPIRNVTVGLLLFNELNNIVHEVHSGSNDIESLETFPVKLSWDTSGVSPGEYNAKLIINYPGGIVDRDLVLNIQPDSLGVVGVGFSISRNYPTSSNGQTFLIIFLVLLLVVVNVVWIILSNRKKHR